MLMSFNAIKTAIAAQFARMQKHPMFRVDIGPDRDTLWATYLASFPPGTNPIYRERTEHDCSCCRQFIRTVGDVVAVIDGALVSVWSVTVPSEPGYEAVCDAMADLVLSLPIKEPFLHYEPVAGTDRNFEMVESIADNADAGPVKTWTHFFVNIDRRYVQPKSDIPSRLSELRSAHDVFLRSLQEISPDAIDTVLDLIAQNSLYRGEEHTATVRAFQTLKMRFDRLEDDQDRDLFAWTADASGAVSRIRNTVIGTLLTDLSEGKDLEDAVKAFESKVAPTNYKRPSALITPAMVAKAKETLTTLGLTSALDRRYATLRDISVDDILFADRAARETIDGDVFDDLARATGSRLPSSGKGKSSLDRVEEVPIARFLSDILPRAESIEVMFENRHAGNLVSLIAPCDPTARPLFKWGNLFSWSYAGELADAIKERVKRAGGSVTGDLCCRLAWSNRDDLDFHMKEPGGYEIYFGTKYMASPSGGRLDVDMNVGGETREPVENIFYASRGRMREGEYGLFVHQYRARETDGVGFECEIDYLGETHRFSYDKPVRQNERVVVARFRYTHKGGFEIIESLSASTATRTLWSIPTQTFHRVSVLCLSPNHWGRDLGDRVIGNLHYFFILAGCKNDGSARGFFNEFLREDLTPHRKVFEVVASKMKPVESDDQLSGLGFSSTRRDHIVCRVKGAFTRTIKIVF